MWEATGTSSSFKILVIFYADKSIFLASNIGDVTMTSDHNLRPKNISKQLKFWSVFQH